jgi:hypothetical protein
MKPILITVNPPNWKVEGKLGGKIWVGWLPLLILPAATLQCRLAFPPWVFMWLLAASIFACCKWQTWWDAHAEFGPGWRRSAGYLFLWPGMDAHEFLGPVVGRPSVDGREWLAALFKTLGGAVLFWSAGRLVSFRHPLLAGWIGMLGIILFLHFGSFDLISCAWRSAGIRAQPIMRQPLKSESLAEFWGKRWNLGFRKLSFSLVFRPLKNKFGATTGTLAAFLASGLIHDLVISVPARAGYGLPTVYFLIQGCGVIAERTDTGKKLGLGRGGRGWVWMSFVTLAPLFILFHPWFVLRVILPFLHALVG